MSSLLLRFILRPYTSGPLPANAAVCSRFFTTARITCPQHGNAFQTSICSSSRSYSNSKESKNKEDEGADAAAERSRATGSRIQKLKESNALQYPRFEHLDGIESMTIPEFRRKYKDKASDTPVDHVFLQGRISSIRKMSSKLWFINMASNARWVQVMVNFADAEASGVTLEQFKATIRSLLRGDCIGVAGSAYKTPTGELTLRADQLPKVLSPSLAPIPEKLINEETMVQNRHLHLLVNQRSSQILHFRSNLIFWLRAFFHEKEFVEVQTPLLADYAGGAVARPFLTSATEFPEKELALRIAPELWLKRLVVGGFDKVFEIGPSFRNEGLDGTHNPEFTMCEFYSTYTNLPDLMNLTTHMFRELAKYSSELIETKYKALQAPDISYFQDFEQIEFIPGLEEAMGFQFPDLTAQDAQYRLVELVRDQASLKIPGDMALAKLLDFLAATYLEPRSIPKPLYITHHPAVMSPLAKSFTCPKTGQFVAARAELFVQGREIANMYEEENDPFEQRRKFEVQLEGRNASGDEEQGPAKIDESYIHALEHGLPPTGGWGCGIDRLVMLYSGTHRISDTLSFGNLRNVLGVSQVSSGSDI